jgi:ubiquinone/menaquinone biosynthesis C-methylase UbiE
MKDFNKIDFFIQRQRNRLVEKYIPLGTYLLDIGCGLYPRNLVSLEKRTIKAVGIDLDTPHDSPSEKISLIRYKIEKQLPFPDNEFDCITMLAVLEHLDYPDEVIDECRRVLRPGGKLIITIPTIYSKPLLLTLSAMTIISREEIVTHKNYFGKKQLEGILSSSGLTKVISRYYNIRFNLLVVYEKT